MLRTLSLISCLLSAPALAAEWKFEDHLHQEARRVSSVMCRSIDAQAEFWTKIGMLAEANPEMSFNDIVKMQLAAAQTQPFPTLAVA